MELNVVVPFEHIDEVPLNVPADGGAEIVISLVAVAFSQPPVPNFVYVIVAEPAARPVIKPVEALMLAIEGADEVQVPPLTVELNLVVDPIQIYCVPVNVPGSGAAVTVSSLEAVELGHPPVPKTVYTIVAVPAAIGITIPFVSFILATVVSLDDQVPLGSVEEKVVVLTPPLVQIN